MVSLYWRPSDSRARILFVTKDHRGRDQYYCLPLSSLRILRHKSSLQLCQVRKSNGDFKLWARLNFVFHERMVLFYSTFVAMKHQDNREPLDEAVIEDFDLSEREDFGGVIRHGDLLHALRVFTDFSSGVVRLEASPLRGPKQDVPLWTAFITRYAHDPDWLALENGGAVSMIALKPSPYIFLAGYSLPKKRNGEYLLHFATSKGPSKRVHACRRSSNGDADVLQMLLISSKLGTTFAGLENASPFQLTALRIFSSSSDRHSSEAFGQRGADIVYTPLSLTRYASKD